VSTPERFFVALLLVFGLPWLAWRLAGGRPRLPLVVVQIVCGLLLGPGALGAVFPGYYAAVFPPPVIDALNGVAWWAVVLFVWLAGVELDLREAWRRRADTAVTAGLALLCPLVAGAGVAAVLAGLPGFSGAAAAPWQFVLGVGMACAVTALPILVLLMEQLGVLRTPLGQRILRYASLDDLLLWAVLALVLADWARVGRQALFLLAFGPAAAGARRWLPGRPEADRLHLALCWLAACAVGADWAGLHFMVGAFLAGAVLDAAWFGQARVDALRHHVLLVLMPVFFLSTGLRTRWDVDGLVVFGAALALLVAAVSGKLLAARIAGRLLGWPPGDAAIVGWLLQTKALIAIVFATVLLDKALITGTAFTALLLMAVMSTLLTMPLVAPRLAARGDG
jgi:Kef-type K+ transport system membrane component KefB